MANRTMLFAVSDIPDGTSKQELKLIGLSEFSYHLPTIYQLLVSTSPQFCHSCVFKAEAHLAIAGDAQGGLATLRKVRDRLPDSAAALPAIEEAITFLSREHNQYPYFLLEPAEVFDMLGKPLPPQMDLLLEQISKLDLELITRKAHHSAKQQLWASGCWSNVLYYTPKGSVKPPPSSSTSAKQPTPSSDGHAESSSRPRQPSMGRTDDSHAANEHNDVVSPLEPSSLSGFEACVEMVDQVFGADARMLSLAGHSLKVSFSLASLRVISVTAEAEGSDYAFKSEPIHNELCKLMSEALLKIVKEKSLHKLDFNLAASGAWVFTESIDEDRIESDHYERSLLDLKEQRVEWFRQFIQQHEVREFDFHSSSMPRHFGPLWPAYRFGYLLGHSQDSLWIMSHGLSNPVFYTDDSKWKQSNGIGCELLVRGSAQKQDLTAPAMDILEGPEIMTMIALCNTMLNMVKNDGLNRRAKALTVELEYHKPTLFRPIKPSTPFVMANASSFALCDNIPCLGRSKALPLIASPVPESMKQVKPAAIAQALVDNDTLGLLPKLNSRRRN